MTRMVRDVFLAFARVHILHHAAEERIFGVGMMKELARQHQTMVVVTHEIEFARDVADRVIFMEGGRIVEQGPPDQILVDPKDPRTREFLRKVLK